MRTRTIAAIFIGGVLVISGILVWSCTFDIGIGMTDEQVKRAARAASVQTMFYQPLMHAYFTDKLPETVQVTEESLRAAMQKDIDKIRDEIKEAVSEERKWQNAPRWETFVSVIDRYGYQSQSRTQIPLGALVDEPARFPERVLVVAKVDKKEIKEWEKDFEKDVLAISETANVSPSKAKEILSRLRTDGYSVSKEAVAESSDVVLLHFSSGWNDAYPTKLDWTVEIEKGVNLITGYDPRGILEVRPIPETNGDIQRVHVKAGYHRMKPEYREKSGEVKEFEKKIKDLERQLKDREEELDKLRKEKHKVTGEGRRNIMNATWHDVRMGHVKIEEFWMSTAASGIFLGNASLPGVNSSFGPFKDMPIKQVGIVLTNAHVAAQALNDEVFTDDEGEHLWIVGSGVPFIRYTDQSDSFGSPAQILTIDGMPVYSEDVDAAIMTTNAVPGFERNKALLGNSDKVRVGDRVILTGNPAGLQKFTFQGIISALNHSLLDGINADRFLKYIKDKPTFQAMRNANMWFDAASTGGTSGSGVVALDGSEKGKVIGLHNMGLAYVHSLAVMGGAEKPDYKGSLSWLSGRLSESVSDIKEHVFRPWDYRKASFTMGAPDILAKHPSFGIVRHGLMIEVEGMNGAVPINSVKRYLQERGLDPQHFGWAGLKKEYWEK
ncbi:MAG: trypsin-like peptidase domain-containing protein [Gammaproteobacteria bacterium]|nr:trypsin-like peptidase domain-containing protein [Gammaproteobacteria bacterium]